VAPATKPGWWPSAVKDAASVLRVSAAACAPRRRTSSSTCSPRWRFDNGCSPSPSPGARGSLATARSSLGSRASSSPRCLPVGVALSWRLTKWQRRASTTMVQDRGVASA
jgi:hypothetical protein